MTVHHSVHYSCRRRGADAVWTGALTRGRRRYRQRVGRSDMTQLQLNRHEPTTNEQNRPSVPPQCSASASPDPQMLLAARQTANIEFTRRLIFRFFDLRVATRCSDQGRGSAAFHDTPSVKLTCRRSFTKRDYERKIIAAVK